MSIADLKEKIEKNADADASEEAKKILFSDWYDVETSEIADPKDSGENYRIWASSVDLWLRQNGLSSFDSVFDDLINQIYLEAEERGKANPGSIGLEDGGDIQKRAKEISNAARKYKNKTVMIVVTKNVFYRQFLLNPKQEYNKAIINAAWSKFDDILKLIVKEDEDGLDDAAVDDGLTEEEKIANLAAALDASKGKVEPTTTADTSDKKETKREDYARATQCALLSSLSGLARMARHIAFDISDGGTNHWKMRSKDYKPKGKFMHRGRILSFFTDQPENFINYLTNSKRVAKKGYMPAEFFTLFTPYFEVHKVDAEGNTFYIPNHLGIGDADGLDFADTITEGWNEIQGWADDPDKAGLIWEKQEKFWELSKKANDPDDTHAEAFAKDELKGKLGHIGDDLSSIESSFSLKSATIDYEGGTPATNRNDVTVSLVYEFKSLSLLECPFYIYKTEKAGENTYTRDLKQPLEISHRFKPVDLILYGYGADDASGPGSIFTRTYNPDKQRIKIKYGTYINPSTMDKQQKYIDMYNKWYRGIWKAAPLNDIAAMEGIKKLGESFVELDLSIVDHSLALKEDGNADEWELTINYRGYMQSLLTSPIVDCLAIASDKSLKGTEGRIIREKEIADKVQDADCSFAAIQKLYRQFNIELAHAMKNNYGRLLRGLVLGNKLNKTWAKKAGLNSILEGKPVTANILSLYSTGYSAGFPEIGPAGNQINHRNINDEGLQVDNEGEVVYNYDEETTNDKDAEWVPIDFFYIGDILEIGLDSCFIDNSTGEYTSEDYINDKVLGNSIRDLRIITGCFKYVDFDNVEHLINISEIPVSLDFFMGWFHENVVKKQRTTYPVASFVRDLCEVAVSNLLSDVCFGPTLETRLNFKTSFLQSFANQDFFNNPPTSGYCHFKQETQGPALLEEAKSAMSVESTLPSNPVYLKVGKGILKNGPPTDEKTNCYYLVVAPANHNFFSRENSGTKESLYKNSVPYCAFGLKKTGPVKKINFSKTDSPGLREARFFNNGGSGLTLLSTVYDATFETWGPVLDFYPGGLIYLDPVDLSRRKGMPNQHPYNAKSMAFATGLGGYHIVTKVSISYTQKTGEATQSITAKWVYSGAPSEVRTVGRTQAVSKPPITQDCQDAMLELKSGRMSAANLAGVDEAQETHQANVQHEQAGGYSLTNTELITDNVNAAVAGVGNTLWTVPYRFYFGD